MQLKNVRLNLRNYLNLNRSILSDLSDDPILIKIFPKMVVFLKSKKIETPLITSPLQDKSKEILDLVTSEATQRNYISTKIIKTNSDNISTFSKANFNDVVETSIYLK